MCDILSSFVVLCSTQSVVDVIRSEWKNGIKCKTAQKHVTVNWTQLVLEQIRSPKSNSMSLLMSTFWQKLCAYSFVRLFFRALIESSGYSFVLVQCLLDINMIANENASKHHWAFCTFIYFTNVPFVICHPFFSSFASPLDNTFRFIARLVLSILYNESNVLCDFVYFIETFSIVKCHDSFVNFRLCVKC